MATANTFGASSFKLEKMGIKEGVEIINTEAVKHAKAAAKPGQYVAGDLGPVGEMLSPMGSMTVERAKAIYVHQAGIIEAAGVDLFLIETIFDLNEALAAFYPEDEVLFAKNIIKIKALGVDIVGGCCGTTPAFIRRLRESI